MHVRPYKRKGRKDKLIIDAWKEYSRGLVPSRFFEKDEHGQHFSTKHEADEFIKRKLEEISLGGKASNTARTFGDALNLYDVELTQREAAKKGSPKHYGEVRRRIENHVKTLTLRGVPICDVRLSGISYHLLVTDLLPQISATGLSNSSMSDVLLDVRSAFKHAAKARWIGFDPATDLSIPQAGAKYISGTRVDPYAERPESQPLEIQKYDYLKQNFDSYIGAVAQVNADAVLPLITAMETGMRPSELMALTPAQIGPAEIMIDRAWVRFEKGRREIGYPKNGEAREVGIRPELRKALIEHKLQNGIHDFEEMFGHDDHSPFLKAWREAQFLRNGWLLLITSKKHYRLIRLTGSETETKIKQLRAGHIGRARNAKRTDGTVFAPPHALVKAAKFTKTPLFNFYDLRHYYCSLLFADGADIAHITELMGHSSEQITRRHYKHWMQSPKRNEAARQATSVHGDLNFLGA